MVGSTRVGRWPVAALLADVQHLGQQRVGDVDGEDVVGRGRGGPERHAVRRQARLVAEQRHTVGGDGREGRQQLRLAAVGGDVVDVQDAGVGGQRAGDRGRDAAFLRDDQRLMGLQHRGRDQPSGLHGIGRVRHVQDDHPALEVADVGGEQQGRVVVGALVALLVDVAVHLEAADRAERGQLGRRRAVRPHQLGVAGEPLGGTAAVVVLLRDLSLQSGRAVGTAPGLVVGCQRRCPRPPGGDASSGRPPGWGPGARC